MIDDFARPAVLCWEPILAGSLAETAADSVREVAAALTREEWDSRRLGPGVGGGNMGLAIFYQEAFRALQQPMYEECRDARWNAAIDQLANATTNAPHLFAGYTGVGWATDLLGSTLPCDEVEGDLDWDGVHEELEEALLRDLAELHEPANFDLIAGPVGWGLYSLQRWPHPRAQRALDLIVDFLERTAESTPSGIRWWTSPDLLPAWQREAYPDGYYNLGIAHGIPAIWVLLGQVIERGIRMEHARRLLDGAVRWVLSQRIETGGTMFPSMVAEGQSARRSRLAWCYGDLGIAAALLVAARCTGREPWETEAISIARNAAKVSFEESRVEDSGLCHGAAGLGHTFNRMYQATGDESLLEAARSWLRRALEMRLADGGVAGYASRRTEGDRPDGPWIWAPTPGILEGAAGVALALLGGFARSEPTWDRLLFLSSVPVPASSSSG